MDDPTLDPNVAVLRKAIREPQHVRLHNKGRYLETVTDDYQCADGVVGNTGMFTAKDWCIDKKTFQEMRLHHDNELLRDAADACHVFFKDGEEEIRTGPATENAKDELEKVKHQARCRSTSAARHMSNQLCIDAFLPQCIEA